MANNFRFLLPFLLVLPLIAQALPQDRQQVVTISANSADLNRKSGVGVYHGDVEVDQGTTHLRSAAAKTFNDKDNKLKEAIANGSKHIQAHFWSTTELNKPPMHAYADTIKYYPKTHIVVLIGKARVSQGKDSYSAPKIRYNMETMHVVSEPSHKGRIQIVIHPDKESKKKLS